MFRPTQFGKYYLTERIAVGGMAELFKAKLFGVSGFEKPMVVKQILPKYARNAEFIKMFIDEAKIAVTLTHGNIVPVYELGRIDGVYFIAMEYVPGKDLADILETARAKNAPLTIEHAVYLTIEICKGLDYAHRRTDPDGNPLRVVHRDISPPNVLVSYDGEVKITDFGIAMAAHKLGSTEAGVVKGTFGYMSPEQVRGLPVNHKTDIFSAGILLHEMLTGRRLFVGESEYDAIERVKAAKVPAPSSQNPRVPAAIDPIVYKALAKDPADRYTDANEFQLSLSRFLFTSGSGASASTLSRTMQALFGDEEEKRRAAMGSEEIVSQLPARETDNTMREGIGARPRSENSQIFAARAEIKNVHNAETVVSDHPAPEMLLSPDGTAVDRSQRRPQVDVGAGKGVAISATMALPSLAPGEAAALSREYDDERTNVFKGARPPQRPEVPELRFPAKPEKETRSARPDPLPSHGPLHGFPSSEELASLADALDEVEAKPPSKLPAPGGRAPEHAATPARPTTPARPATARPTTPAPAASTAPAGSRAPAEEEVAAAAKSTSDSGLLGLLARPPSAEMSPVGAAPSEEVAPVARPQTDVVVQRSAARASRPRTGSERQQPGRPKRISGIVSSTMRLFVDGIEEEEPAPSPDLPPAEGEAGLDHVPRTIKPTVLGWSLILLVVLAAAGFVVYKKTTWFRTPVDEGGDLVRPEDLKRAAQKPGEKKATIQLASAPEGASFFQFVGETPVTLGQLDPGRTYLLRIEREGYHPVYQTVDGKSWNGTDKAQIKVTLNPAGASAEESLPALPETAATGKQGALQVASDPPMAMVWLLVGKGGKVELKDVDATKSYNFKALLKGHQLVLVNVAPVDFDRKTGIYKTVVRLEPDGAATEAGAKPSPDGGAKPEPKPEPKLEPKPEPKLEPKPEPKLEPKPKPEPKLKIKVQPKPKPKIKRPPPKKKKKEEKKAGPKLPDWAK